MSKPLILATLMAIALLSILQRPAVVHGQPAFSATPSNTFVLTAHITSTSTPTPSPTPCGVVTITTGGTVTGPPSGQSEPEVSTCFHTPLVYSYAVDGVMGSRKFAGWDITGDIASAKSPTFPENPNEAICLTPALSTCALDVSARRDPWIADTITPSHTIEGVVWLDVNVNGLQDDDVEYGISFVVNLLDSHNVAIDSTTTDINGRYAFTSVAPLSYVVQVMEPLLYSDFWFTSRNSVETGESYDSHVNDEGRSDLLNLTSHVPTTATVNAGYLIQPFLTLDASSSHVSVQHPQTETFTYTVSIVNEGPVFATDVEILFGQPDYTTVVAESSTPFLACSEYDDGVCRIWVGTLEPHELRQFEIVLVMHPHLPESVTLLTAIFHMSYQERGPHAGIDILMNIPIARHPPEAAAWEPQMYLPIFE